MTTNNNEIHYGKILAEPVKEFGAYVGLLIRDDLEVFNFITNLNLTPAENDIYVNFILKEIEESPEDASLFIKYVAIVTEISEETKSIEGELGNRHDGTVRSVRTRTIKNNLLKYFTGISEGEEIYENYGDINDCEGNNSDVGPISEFAGYRFKKKNRNKCELKEHDSVKFRPHPGRGAKGKAKVDKKAGCPDKS